MSPADGRDPASNGTLEAAEIRAARRLTHKSTGRNDEPFYEEVFPDTEEGKFISTILRIFLCKDEHRMGWPRKGACSDQVLLPHPNETISSHQWGMGIIIMLICKSPKFRKMYPDFDELKAKQMADMHDVAEAQQGDLTPLDNVEPDLKHKVEREAMDEILDQLPIDIKKAVFDIYNAYEARECLESKFVKDCDRLDFLLTAFMRERQGFTNLEEFYKNCSEVEFHTDYAKSMYRTLIDARDELLSKGTLYPTRL